MGFVSFMADAFRVWPTIELHRGVRQDDARDEGDDGYYHRGCRYKCFLFHNLVI